MPLTGNAPAQQFGQQSNESGRDMWAHLFAAGNPNYTPPAPPTTPSYGSGYDPQSMYQYFLNANGYQSATAQLPYLMNRAYLSQVDYGAQSGFATNQYNLGLQDIGLRQQDLGLRRASNELDRARIGISRQGNVIDREYINKLRGFAETDLNQTLLGQMAEGVNRTRANNSQATETGSWFAPGRQITNESILFDTRLAGERARLAYQRELAGLDKREKELALSDLDLDIQSRRIDIANQQLDLMAQQLGIDRQRLALDLQQTLHRLGMGQAQDLNTILSAVASTNARIREIGTAALMQLIQYTYGQGAAE